MITPSNIEKYQSYYSENKLWNKIVKVAKKAGINTIYMILLLYYILESPEVSTADKAKIYGALGYFILPIDLIPDMIPVVGYTDDIAALLWALHAVAVNITPEMKIRAKGQLQKWFGEFDEKELTEQW